MSLEQVIIPFISAAAGFAAANWKDILGWRRMVQKEELEIGMQLMKAINDGRKEIMEAYEIIERMEIENRTLKRENMELTIERDNFKLMADELRAKLDKVTKDFDKVEKQVHALKTISDEKDKT